MSGRSSPAWDPRPIDDYYNQSDSLKQKKNYSRLVGQRARGSNADGPQPLQTSTQAINQKKLESPASRLSLMSNTPINASKMKQAYTPSSILTTSQVGTPKAMLDRQKHRLLLSNYLDKSGITPKNNESAGAFKFSSQDDSEPNSKNEYLMKETADNSKVLSAKKVHHEFRLGKSPTAKTIIKTAQVPGEQSYLTQSRTSLMTTSQQRMNFARATFSSIEKQNKKPL